MKMNVFEIIEQQQKGHENEPRFAIGEQLKEMCRRDPAVAEMVAQDLEKEEMSLEAVEKHFHDYADKNHGSKKVFCITPVVAEQLIRKFYGLSAEAPVQQEGDFLDLSSFL